MQPQVAELFNSSDAENRALVHNVLIDFDAGLISPMSLEALPQLLARISRYGMFRGLRLHQQCTVLQHSMHVALFAGPDFLGAELTGPWCSALQLYAGLHDLGEIFGGDIPKYIPAKYRETLQTYQSEARANCQRSCGLPSALPIDFKNRLAAADRLAFLLERKALAFSIALPDSFWTAMTSQLSMGRSEIEAMIDRALEEHSSSVLMGFDRAARAFRKLFHADIGLVWIEDLHLLTNVVDTTKIPKDPGSVSDWARTHNLPARVLTNLSLGHWPPHIERFDRYGRPLVMSS